MTVAPPASSQPGTVTRQDELRFVALGDSTTVGIGDPVPDSGWRGWARLLADELAARHRLSYTNLAVAGATGASVREGQLAQALRLRPHLASVVVGINDTMRSTWDEARVHDDIVRCVGALTESGAVVMTVRFHDHGAVLGLPSVLRRPVQRRIELLNQAYEDAHARYGGVCVDLTDDPIVYQRPFWSIDRLHPSELGHRRLAHEFAVHLQMLGFPVACPEAGVCAAPSRWHGYWWLATQGLPWAGRRAHDLFPWAVRMALAEAATRARARAA